MTHTPSSNLYITRQQKLAAALQAGGLDGVAINPGPSLVYLTGMHFHLSERPVVAFFFPRGEPVIVAPELEAAKLSGLAYPIQSFLYGEDPETWAGVFARAAQAAGLPARPILGVEPRGLRLLELRLLEAALPGASYPSADGAVAALRMVKDGYELACMRKAVEIAQQALLATLPSIKTGMTEKVIAAELTAQLLRAGADPLLPFTPIVSGGPNSANPHAFPGERPLQTGDLLVIDWGAAYEGYFSDLTRTFAIGQPDDEMARIAALVEAANAAGRAAAGPEVLAGDVDAAARAVIEAGGYGPYFTHRTGHGLGMEGHEEPYIRSGSSLALAPGNTFTIEPGIYLPGRNGVRIEDNMVITASGAETLSSLPRGLAVLG